MTTRDVGLLDTSVLIAQESGRGIDFSVLPGEALISVITLAELEAGVLSARTTTERAARLRTLTRISYLQALTVDRNSARHWAVLRSNLAEHGRRLNANDLWIAAIALANHLPVVTQDDDFDVIADLGGPEIIRV